MCKDDPVTIRKAEARDAETIYAMVVELAHATGTADKVDSTVDDIRRDGFGDKPAFTALLAEIGGKPVGLCLYFPYYSSFGGYRGIYVQDLFVSQDTRGLGIGETLLRAVAKREAANGARSLRLAVDTANIAAQKFYTRLGIVHLDDERAHMIRGAEFLALARDKTDRKEQ